MGARITAFKEAQCTRCGVCLNKCPVLALPIDEAKAEFERLIDRRTPSAVLSRCNSCMSCNLYCPEKAHPYNLILERWNELYAKRGAPPLYRFVCPTETPNIWQLMNLFLSDSERKWITEWMSAVPGPDDRVLLIGNYTHLFPFIIGGSALLDHFKPIDRIDQWEGGAYLYQGGYLDLVREIALSTRRDFDEWGAKEVVFLTDAVHHLCSSVHPREMGVSHERTFVTLNEWLAGKLQAGAITLPAAPLGMRVTVHDNCYSKVHGGLYWDTPRELLQRCGCTVVEMRHIKKDSLCCGFGAGASWVRNMSMPFDIISEGAKKIREAEDTGAEALVSYCSGCIYLLWAARELTGSKIKIYHLLEVVRMAMGETINYPEDHVRRAWDVIAIITYQLGISLFQKNFFIKELSYDNSKSTFSPGNRRILKSIRWILGPLVMRAVYGRVFRTMMPLIRTR